MVCAEQRLYSFSWKLLLIGDDDRQYYRELFELLNDMIKEEFANNVIFNFIDDKALAPQKTGERILRSIAMALEENGYRIDPVDPWDSFWGVRASDGKIDFAVELVFHEPDPHRWWHISLEDRHRRRIKDPFLLERLKQIIYSRVTSLPFIKGSSCVSGGYSKMHERRGIIPSLEPGFGGWFLTN